ncbi:transcription factor TFIIIB subunit brf1 [Serendipita sp. 396]|nr:transcription factor TFIIIB subunit brf1 [Serendipita sp. 396]KAG8781360.1 transcription factor TFIIIB subunit brf1 [Serendipita sp. 397]KAG8801249.1 transcription factor TFIIIB subunit brf1 [Serendipita sp. 398]KAG8826234.1 transcription factor TFIIIB subunit brf1 [Serendipita sp. 401]KAG8837929.1 transcription factor TFIIIB subunit brf1 [Serendipita sp. 400]KAG8858099.1 transcription factor TFIIIB subunit brf1 [Serendipita sp. 411]KAG8868387.1 transcription factor TFIIIB subunit brf1 [Se
MRKAQCSSCGGVSLETDSAAGTTVCTDCGTVLEESNIVSEIAFLETSSGAAAVSGSLVARNATATRIMGPNGRSSGMESAEITKERSQALLRRYQQPFSLPDAVITHAERHLTLAYQYSFTKGRHIEHVIAVCLYMGCREVKTSHMLIDFADVLRINVFALGATYLKWRKTLGWNVAVSLLEPSIFIGRFVAMLDFGEDERKVAEDATRIATRFKEDWIHEGRRTAGICGASIYIAAQMNNYRRSVQEIVQVVKIADTTIVKRLEEFSATSSAALTVGDFRVTGHPTEAADPPSFTRARQLERELEEGPGAENAAKRRTRKRKRKKGSEDGNDSDYSDSSQRQSSVSSDEPLVVRARQLQAQESSQLDDGVLHGEIFRSVTAGDTEDQPPSSSTLPARTEQAEMEDENWRPGNVEDLEVDPAQVEEVREILESEAGQMALAVVKATSNNRQREESVVTDGQIEPEDELKGLDEDELDNYICGEEEARLKERVWTEFNLDWLRKLAAKRIKDQTGEDPRPKKKRKVDKKPFTPGKTAFESVQAMMERKPQQFSKRINYSALRAALSDSNHEDKKDDGEDEAFMDEDEYVDGDIEDYKEDDKADDDKADDEPYADATMREFHRRMRSTQEDDEYGGEDYYEQEA